MFQANQVSLRCMLGAGGQRCVNPCRGSPPQLRAVCICSVYPHSAEAHGSVVPCAAGGSPNGWRKNLRWPRGKRVPIPTVSSHDAVRFLPSGGVSGRPVHQISGHVPARDGVGGTGGLVWRSTPGATRQKRSGTSSPSPLKHVRSNMNPPRLLLFWVLANDLPLSR